MTTSLRASLAAVAVAAATVVPVVSAHADPSAAPTRSTAQQACLDKGGVWVIVDNPGAWVRTGCAQQPADGEDALTQIGVTLTHSSGGFISALDGFPAKDASASGIYWNYFHQVGDGAWEYSTLGPAAYEPAPGTTEAWVYGRAGVTPLESSTTAPSTAAPSPGTPSTAASPAPTTPPRPDDSSPGSPLPLVVTATLIASGVAGLLYSRRRRGSPT